MISIAGFADETLIEMALDGHGECFTELMGRHERVVRGRIRSIVRNPFDADDLLQEVSFKAWRCLSTLRAESSFRAWLTRIATNEALMLHRREKRMRLSQVPFELDFLASPSEPADRFLTRAEEARLLRTAVLRLPSKYRQVVALCDLEQLSVRETAQRLNSAIPAIKTRLFRGRRLLAKEIRESGIRELSVAAASVN